MANHAYICTDEEVDGARLKALLDQVNEERFGGLLKFQANGDHFMALINDYESFIEIWVHEPTEYSEEDAKLEVRHGHGYNVAWYTDFYISNWIAEKLNGCVIDESDGERQTPDFHKRHPRLSSMIDAWSYGGIRRICLKLERKDVGKELFKIL